MAKERRLNNCPGLALAILFSSKAVEAAHSLSYARFQPTKVEGKRVAVNRTLIKSTFLNN